ncbi:MAG: hypothetical protein A7316_01480 [Candidatus Altiarchaeales archaeon WOR_SM1_86-2]|nr:MAG: hypothetical protein A7316_01480 [Candidatus Altiarchaeales archaeon WOR_SM1_86-2]
MDHLGDAYILFSVPIFSYKIKDQKQYPKKIYCIDAGLINMVSFRFMEDAGKFYENLAAVELLLRGKEICYWKDRQHREVDFVIKEDLKVNQLIRICYDIDDPETKKREINGLIKASGELNCKNLLW